MCISIREGGKRKHRFPTPSLFWMTGWCCFVSKGVIVYEKESKEKNVLFFPFPWDVSCWVGYGLLSVNDPSICRFFRYQTVN